MMGWSSKPDHSAAVFPETVRTGPEDRPRALEFGHFSAGALVALESVISIRPAPTGYGAAHPSGPLTSTDADS
jgi:hypothetical protein